MSIYIYEYNFNFLIKYIKIFSILTLFLIYYRQVINILAVGYIRVIKVYSCFLIIINKTKKI